MKMLFSTDAVKVDKEIGRDTSSPNKEESPTSSQLKG